MFLLFRNAGCSTSTVPADFAAVSMADSSGAVSPRPAASDTLNIMVDWSGSCSRPSMQECWNSLRRELPRLIESLGIDHLALWSFDEDGWCPKLISEISLPLLNLPPQRESSAGEWDSFKNIRDALRESEDRDWLNSSRTAQAGFRRALLEALKPLESAEALPETDYEARKTDIVGLLKRLSASREERARFFILITDLADTQYRELPCIPRPEGETRAVVLLLPAQPKDALLTIGRTLSGPEQFELRSRQLKESAPWLLAVPYFSDDVPSALGAKPTDGLQAAR
jgi:hypothetical protein